MHEAPGQRPVPAAVREALEPLARCPHLGGAPPAAARREPRERVGAQAHEALRLHAAREGPHRVGGARACLGPLPGGPLLHADQRAAACRALWEAVMQGPVGGITRRMSPPSAGLPAAARVRPSGTAAARGRPRVPPPCGTRRPRRRRAGRQETARGCAGASGSEAGDRPRALPPWGLTPPGPTAARHARAGAPPPTDVEWPLDLRAVGAGVGAPRARRASLEVARRRGAPGLQDGSTTLPRPGEPWAPLREGAAIGVRGQARRGRLALRPEALGLDEPGARRVVIKPGTPRCPDRRGARGGVWPRRGRPSEHALQALEAVGRPADPADPRLVLGMLGQGFPLVRKKHDRR